MKKYIFKWVTVWKQSRKSTWIDPLGRPTIPAGSDHYFGTCCPYVRLSPLFKSSKTTENTVETVGLAEWIIDDTCLVWPIHFEYSWYGQVDQEIGDTHGGWAGPASRRDLARKVRPRPLLLLLPHFRLVDCPRGCYWHQTWSNHDVVQT